MKFTDLTSRGETTGYRQGWKRQFNWRKSWRYTRLDSVTDEDKQALDWSESEFRSWSIGMLFKEVYSDCLDELTGHPKDNPWMKYIK